MTHLFKLVLLFGTLLITGCSSALNVWGTTVPMGEKKYAPVPTEHVMILFEAPKQEYDQIGLVSALGGMFASDGDMFKKMQREAARLGADAIIVRPADGTPTKTGDGVTIIQSQKSGWEYPKTTAIAIKYR
jgi:hypothetical protein